MTGRTIVRSGPGRRHMGGWKPVLRVSPRFRIDGRLSVLFAATNECHDKHETWGKDLHSFHQHHTRLLSSFRLTGNSKIVSRSIRNAEKCFDQTGKHGPNNSEGTYFCQLSNVPSRTVPSTLSCLPDQGVTLFYFQDPAAPAGEAEAVVEIVEDAHNSFRIGSDSFTTNYTNGANATNKTFWFYRRERGVRRAIKK